MLRRLSVIVASLVLAVPGPGRAWHDPDEPVLGRVRLTGAGWVAFRFWAPAQSHVFLGWTASSFDSTQTGDIAYLFRAEDAATPNERIDNFYAWEHRGYHHGTEERHIQVADGVTIVDNRSVADREGGIYAHLELGHLNGGEYYFVFSAAFMGTGSGEAVIYDRTPGLKILAEATGSEAFYISSYDFGGTVNALGPGASHLVAQGHAELTVQQRLFGGFTVGPSRTGGVAVGEYEGPLGTSDGSGFYFIAGEPSGDYSFRVSLSGSYLGGAPVFHGAAVTLP